MYVPDSPPRYCAYLLRCWTERRSQPDHAVVWRFSLENPHTGTRHGFASFEALIAFPDSVIFGQRDNIVQSALRSSIPGVYLYREWVAAGGLLAYGPNQASILGGPLPIMVDKILKGAKPGDLPVEHGKLELFVNRGTAQAMRIDLPRSLLSRTDEVIG